MESLTLLRNRFHSFLYQHAVKPICFGLDEEKVHQFFVSAGKKLGSSSPVRRMVSLAFNYEHPILEQEIFGMTFRNPVGLSAGFDKNAELVDILENVGFGFAEIGSVTAKPCKGNEGKRLARIPEQQSLWVHLGLNNEGAKKIAQRLKRKNFVIPIGISIAKTNCKETVYTVRGIEDYIFSLNVLKDIGDYFTLNISCPNAYDGQPFHKPNLYKKLLAAMKKLNLTKPVFVKLSPDLSKKNIDTLLLISQRYEIAGFICSNLTQQHAFGKGGLSGKSVEDKANELLKYVYSKTKGKYILIGVGGIFSAEDAYKKIRLGANLVQIITGMIYQGPQLISEINQGLVRLLHRDGYQNISEAVGSAVKR